MSTPILSKTIKLAFSIAFTLSALPALAEQDNQASTTKLRVIALETNT